MGLWLEQEERGLLSFGWDPDESNLGSEMAIQELEVVDGRFDFRDLGFFQTEEQFSFVLEVPDGQVIVLIK